MKEKKKLFRKALFGYRKEDVNRYILSLSHEAEKNAETIQMERDDAISEADELRDKVTSLKADIEMKEMEVKTLSDEIRSLREELAEAEAELSQKPINKILSTVAPKNTVEKKENASPEKPKETKERKESKKSSAPTKKFFSFGTFKNRR